MRFDKRGKYISHRYTPEEKREHWKLWMKLFIQTAYKAHHSGKYYIPVDNGVLIIPEDFSYTHFINNTWYE